MNQKTTKFRLSQVTKRLDHMVPDPDISASLNAKAAKDLLKLSKKLKRLLPDPSLSPDERLERLARVVQDRVPEIENLQSANAKVHRLKRRLDELVPHENLSHSKKIDYLVKLLEKEAGREKLTNSNKSGKSVVELLEAMGDPRARIKPVR